MRIISYVQSLDDDNTKDDTIYKRQFKYLNIRLGKNLRKLFKFSKIFK